MAGAQSRPSEAAERYAAAVFELALEEKALDRTETDLRAFADLITQSADLSALIESPAFSRDDKARGVAAVAETAGLSDLTRRFLGVAAMNGRARDLVGAARAFQALAARHRGVIVAEVAAPQPLTEAQAKALKAALKKAMGREVEIETALAPELIAGFTVKVGSRLYDASVRSALDGLAQAMKGS